MASDYVRELDRRFRVCPFDDNHIIEKTRFHSHLLKCKKNHDSSNKIMCPYDASEFIAPEMLSQHLLVCKKRDLMLMPTESIKDRVSDMDRPVRKFNVINTDDEEDWDIDGDYTSKDHNEARESFNKLEETNRRIQPFYENVYGAVKTVGRGTYLSHLGGQLIPCSNSSALRPSIPKTQGRIPGIEEMKEDIKDEGEKEENDDDETGNYDDVDEEYYDDDDTGSLLESESFRKHYTDIKLPSRQQNNSLNSTSANSNREQVEEKNSSDSKKVYSAPEIAWANKMAAKKTFGRGYSIFSDENLSEPTKEIKPEIKEEVKEENFSFDEFEKQLEAVAFQPSKARRDGYFTEEEVEDESDTASSVSQSVFSTETRRSAPGRIQNESNENFKSGLSPCVLRLLTDRG